MFYQNDESLREYALDGLQQVMAIKSYAVLPYLVPKLIQPPVNTKALSLLASVAGTALDKELHKILQVTSLRVKALSHYTRNCKNMQLSHIHNTTLLSYFILEFISQL